MTFQVWKHPVTFEILCFLVQDGLTTGTVYVLLALSLWMVFMVTRILFIPQGELVCFSALTLAVLEQGLTPPTAWLTAALGFLCGCLDVIAGIRAHRLRAVAPVALLKAVAPLLVLIVVISF